MSNWEPRRRDPFRHIPSAPVEITQFCTFTSMRSILNYVPFPSLSLCSSSSSSSHRLISERRVHGWIPVGLAPVEQASKTKHARRRNIEGQFERTVEYINKNTEKKRDTLANVHGLLYSACVCVLAGRLGSSSSAFIHILSPLNKLNTHSHRA